MKASIQNPVLSLSSLLGRDYTKAVCSARASATGEDMKRLEAIADEKVEFYPQGFAKRVDELIDSVGTQVCPAFQTSACGATTNAFIKASKYAMAPLSGYGFIRIGEDGRAYLISKSEHYHASLGHHFPGYRLIENAKKLGIANITLVSVMERTGEIGLRRAIGATRGHIAAQFLFESASMGVIGGVLGASLGVILVVAVSAYQVWTPVLDPAAPLLAPLIGGAIGLVSGSYPATEVRMRDPTIVS